MKNEAARRAAALVERGPLNDAPAGYGALTRAARQFASRLNRHDRLHQREIQHALLEAIEAEGGEAAARIDALAALVDAAERRLIEMEILTAGLVAPPAADVAGWQARLAAPVTPADGQPRRAVNVETDVGPLLVSEHDRVVHHVLRDTGIWEKEEADALRGLLAPGMTFVDIGAHVGYMSLVAAGAVGPTGRGIAMEPAPGNFELLQANLLRNRAPHVVAVPAAAWKQTGPVTFSLDEFNTGDHRAYARPDAETFQVPGYALDDLIPGGMAIDVVKVDAQGTDHLALQGMAATLRRCRPVMLVEYWPSGIAELGDEPLAVLDIYRDLGYGISVLGVDGIGPAAPNDRILEAAIASPGSFCNLVLRPLT